MVDVYARGETIERIEENIDPSTLPADTQVIDARNRYVFPGFIDPHVHIHLPFMGTNAIDDHESATKAALVGGTTSIIEMICPGPDDEPTNAYNEWKDLAKAGACCDWSFHLAVVRFDELAQRQVRDLVENHGVRSFKIFLAYKGALDISDNLQAHAAGEGTRHRDHRALRECPSRGFDAAEADRRRQDRPGMARALSPSKRRGRRRQPSMHLRGTHGGPRLHRAHLLWRCGLESHGRSSRRRRRHRRIRGAASGPRRQLGAAQRLRGRQVRDVPSASGSGGTRSAVGSHRIQACVHDRHRSCPVQLQYPEGHGTRRLHEDPQRHPIHPGTRRSGPHLRRLCRSSIWTHGQQLQHRRPGPSGCIRARARSPSAQMPIW